MSKFITRVELHGATIKDYEMLHVAMRTLHFHKTITSDNGIPYQLPPAEYYSHGELSSSQVRDLASAAAKTTGLKHWILTTEFSSAAWILN